MNKEILKNKQGQDIKKSDTEKVQPKKEQLSIEEIESVVGGRRPKTRR